MERPSYVRTVPHDGGKYVDPKEFFEDEEIKRQFEWFEESDAGDDKS